FDASRRGWGDLPRSQEREGRDETLQSAGGGRLSGVRTEAADGGTLVTSISYTRGARVGRLQRPTATPHGELPTGTVLMTLKLAVSMMDTSFDGPLAVKSLRPS